MTGIAVVTTRLSSVTMKTATDVIANVHSALGVIRVVTATEFGAVESAVPPAVRVMPLLGDAGPSAPERQPAGSGDDHPGPPQPAAGARAGRCAHPSARSPLEPAAASSRSPEGHRHCRYE